MEFVHCENNSLFIPNACTAPRFCAILFKEGLFYYGWLLVTNSLQKINVKQLNVVFSMCSMQKVLIVSFIKQDSFKSSQYYCLFCILFLIKEEALIHCFRNETSLDSVFPLCVLFLFLSSCSNLDPLTETYGIPFYLQYLAHWPEYFIVAEAPGGELMGYIMGKAEGSVAREEWHGHVTALSVAPEFRRLGLAAKLMELLEEISERKGGFFVDLFVRVSNQVAVNMYKQLGYSVYRTVIEYYSASNGEPDEDAYDMRKALSRDTEKKSVVPLPHPVRPEDIE
ncbi:N-alpha-acetyltransferase 20 isoform X1 [Polyodon spathula]|uniref:N-alpha-acetyltransferase 20 isoform X1 n=1 Tax=Polyodon spathula TaxID=7913 RepID=UPI001B7DB431|nr:N-alpha-acetyltransferase 20 isoform X1 [Polyodon spathula]